MKNLILYFIPALVFFSCSNNEGVVEAHAIAVPQGSITDSGTITKTDTLSENSRLVEKITRPLLSARGSEPGWYAEFFADHLRLLIDNGTDSLIMNGDFSVIKTDEKFHTKLLWEHKKSNIEIEIENKACTEEGSGESREKSISIKYNNKTYKGCATVK